MSTSNPSTATLNPAGSFCWVELGTTDQPAAKAFYSKVLGWTACDNPMGPDEVYTMFQLGGANAAAAYALKKEQTERGVPPHWLLYVAVENADAASEKAQKLGGTVLMPPFDVFDLGRMAVLRDPAGAVFAIWQPKTHVGLGVKDSNGALCWADLSTPDAEKAAAFYHGLFGWHIESGAEVKASGYRHIKNGEAFLGGIPPAAHRNPNVPPHWLAYFQVADCNASANLAKSMGAKLHMPATSMQGVGTIAVVADPQGAVFALFQPMPRK